MQESGEVRDAMVRYWANVGARDFEGCDAIVTSGDVAIVVGTAPGEGHDNRDAWVQGFRSQVEAMPGIGVEPGPALRAYAEGPVGWAVDEPTWILPDGTRLPTRTTSVLRQEDGDWKLVHMHVSIGVPDEKLPEVLSW